MTCLGGGCTFSQNVSSLALTVCDLFYYEDLEEKAACMNQLINHEAVYGTAPATPGLLITKHFSSQINMEGGWLVLKKLLNASALLLRIN